MFLNSFNDKARLLNHKHTEKRTMTCGIASTGCERQFHFLGAKVPQDTIQGNESSREQMFHGAKVPRNESSTHRTFVPGSEKSSILPYGHNRRFSGVTRGRISHFPIDFCMGPTTCSAGALSVICT